MKRAKEFVLQLSNKLAQQSRKAPALVLDSVREENKENFSATYAGGTIHIKAANPLAAAFAITQLKVGIKSSHFSEWLGEITPAFALRPLWIQSDVKCKITSQLTLSLPSFLFDPQKRVIFCQRLISLGYNAILLGKEELTDLPNQTSVDIEELCRFFHEFGLRVILKPQLIKKEQSFSSAIKELFEVIPSLDYLFWEATLSYQEYLERAYLQERTFVEAVAFEIKSLESLLKSTHSLIYYLPSDENLANQQSDRLIQLSNMAGAKTILAFSSVNGPPSADHLSPHPIWQNLRQRHFHSATLFLPIINLGSVKQGEGLWPTTTSDLFDKFLIRCNPSLFAGVVGLTNSIPAEGGMLDCNLWVAGHYLWRRIHPNLLVDTWLLAHRPEWNLASFLQLTKISREIAVDLSWMYSLSLEQKPDKISFEEARTFVECQFAKLKLLQLNLEKIEKKRFKKQEKSTLLEYFTYFARDARRIILHFLQSLNVPGGNILGPEDHLESFWTQSSQPAANGLRGSLHVTFCKTPNCGSKGSRLSIIYAENRLF